MNLSLTAWMCIFAAFVLVTTIAFLYGKNRSLTRKLRLDPLTDIANFAGLEYYIRKQIKVRSLAMALIDINEFRRFNRMGYAQGDKVLRMFASQLKQTFGNNAFCGRYRYGDEFIMVFDRSALDEVIVRLNDMNHGEIVVEQDQGNSVRDSLTFAFGTAIISDSEGLLEEAIRIAQHGVWKGKATAEKIL